MQPPMGGAPSPTSSEPPVGGGPGEGENKDAIKTQLIGLLKQAKQMATSNGLDWNEISQAVSGAESKSSATVPHPPRVSPGLPGM